LKSKSLDNNFNKVFWLEDLLCNFGDLKIIISVFVIKFLFIVKIGAFNNILKALVLIFKPSLSLLLSDSLSAEEGVL